MNEREMEEGVGELHKTYSQRVGCCMFMSMKNMQSELTAKFNFRRFQFSRVIWRKKTDLIYRVKLIVWQLTKHFLQVER